MKYIKIVSLAAVFAVLTISAATTFAQENASRPAGGGGQDIVVFDIVDSFAPDSSDNSEKDDLDIIIGAGSGGVPHVKVFNGTGE